MFHKEPRREEIENTTLPEVSTAEESIPRAMLPWPYDDDRSRFLGLRSSGFGIREALNLISKAKSTLSLWRKDSAFVKLEERLPELRQTLALEYVGMEFLRNLRLVMEKDARVLRKSLENHVRLDEFGNEHTIPMPNQDFQYLLKMRQFYTPVQLAQIESLFGKSSNLENATETWQDLALKRSRSVTVTEEVSVTTRVRTASNLTRVEEKDAQS